MTFGSLFAGIGGMDLGLERAGLKCVWQVEINEYARRVLAKHWPAVPRWDDVRTFPPAEGDWSCDLIAGGFPCQDISVAGKGEGLAGERSGLWFEFARIVRVVRPRFVLVENVSALLVRGMDRVLGDLASCGYDAEWDCIPAAAAGAPHIRDRVFVVAHANGQRRKTRGPAHAGDGRPLPPQAGEHSGMGGRPDVADTGGDGLERDIYTGDRLPSCFGIDARRSLAGAGRKGRDEQWATEPDVGRVADGVPARMDRLRGLGNAVVPQIAEWIGRRLMQAAQEAGS